MAFVAKYDTCYRRLLRCLAGQKLSYVNVADRALRRRSLALGLVSVPSLTPGCLICFEARQIGLITKVS